MGNICSMSITLLYITWDLGILNSMDQPFYMMVGLSYPILLSMLDHKYGPSHLILILGQLIHVWSRISSLTPCSGVLLSS